MDPLLPIVVLFLAVLAIVHLATRGLCDRRGHTWGYEWQHETQREALRCSTCGRWSR